MESILAAAVVAVASPERVVLRQRPVRRSSSISVERRWSRVQIACFGIFVWCTFLYVMHVPMPARVTGETKIKMTVVDTFLRFLIKYPLMGLRMYSSYAQLYWQRHALTFMARVLSSWTASSELQVSDVLIANVPVRVYHPLGERANNGAIIFVHGGGFVLGEVAMYEYITRDLALQARMTVLSIEYRLAPEHAFPAGLNDVESVVTEFLNRTHSDYNVDPHKVVIMGDSAGGNLATVTARRIKVHPSLPKLKAQVLLYPLVQYVNMQLPSYQAFAEYADTSFADPESIARTLLFYAGVDANDESVSAVLGNAHCSLSMWQRVQHDRLPFEYSVGAHKNEPQCSDVHEMHSDLALFASNPDVSPLISDDLHDLPLTLVATTDYDILRDEGYLYAERLRDFSVPVEYLHYEGGFHAMLNLHKELPVAQQMMIDVVAFVHRSL